MGSHIVDGEFQSDKYPTCPRGKVPLSVGDASAQDLLWEYARRRRAVDAEFSDDLESALTAAGYAPGPESDKLRTLLEICEATAVEVDRLRLYITVSRQLVRSRDIQSGLEAAASGGENRKRAELHQPEGK